MACVPVSIAGTPMRKSLPELSFYRKSLEWTGHGQTFEQRIKPKKNKKPFQKRRTKEAMELQELKIQKKRCLCLLDSLNSDSF